MAPVFNFTSPVTARYIRWVGTKHRFDSYDSYFNTTHGFYMQLDEIYLYKPFEKIDPNKWYKIVSKINSNYCIDISGPLYQCGQIIHLWQYAGTVNQQWKFVDVGNGCYHIESRGNTSFGFDDPYGNLTNGTVLQLCDFNNFDDNQKWQVINTGNGDYKIAPKISVNASSVIDLDNGNTVNDGKLQIWTSWDTNFQLWNIVEVP